MNLDGGRIMLQLKLSGLDVWMEHGGDMVVNCPLAQPLERYNDRNTQCVATCAWFNIEIERGKKIARCGQNVIGEIIKED